MICSASPHRLRGRSGRRWSSSARPSRSTIRSRSGSPTPVKAEARRSRVRVAARVASGSNSTPGRSGTGGPSSGSAWMGTETRGSKVRNRSACQNGTATAAGRRRRDDLDCRRAVELDLPTGQRLAPSAAVARCAPEPRKWATASCSSGPPDRSARTRSARPGKRLFMIGSLRASAAQRPPRFEQLQLGGRRVGLEVEHRADQVEILGLAGQGGDMAVDGRPPVLDQQLGRLLEELGRLLGPSPPGGNAPGHGTRGSRVAPCRPPGVSGARPGSA